jgi:hypothetical protein
MLFLVTKNMETGTTFNFILVQPNGASTPFEKLYSRHQLKAAGHKLPENHAR